MKKMIRNAATLLVVGLVGLSITVGTASASNKQATGSTPSCPSPLVFKGTTGSCVPCPKGTQYEAGKCKLPPQPTCDSGYHFNKTTHKCDADATTAPAPTTPTTTTIQGCYTDANGVQYCNQTASDSAVESDVKTEKLSIASGGYLQLKQEMNPAPPKSQIGQCINVIGGTNSYFDSNHHVVWISWAGKPARICHTGRGPTGWQKVGPNEPPCWNYFQPPHKPAPAPVFKGRFKIVQNFTFTAKMTLKLTLHGNVSAEAHCTVGDANNGNSAKANVNGVDTESITVSGTGSGRTWVEAVGNAHQAAITSTEANNLNATVTASATLNMKGSATVSCHMSPPTTPTTTPTTPTGPSTPSTPVQHNCTASVSNLQKDERTATFTVTCDGSISSAIWSFDGSTGNATGTSVTHTFPNSEAGQTAYGHVTVYFTDNTRSWSGSVGIAIPATPPDNNPGPPAQPGG